MTSAGARTAVDRFRELSDGDDEIGRVSGPV